MSRAWHDRPMSPLDTAIHWTEFAAKHPSFTYRTPAADVPFYQYINLDVALVLIAIFSVNVVLLGALIKICCGSKKTTKTKANTKTEKKKTKRA